MAAAHAMTGASVASSPVHPLFASTRAAMDLLLTNQFSSLTSLGSSRSSADLLVARIDCWMRVVHAVTSPDAAEMERTLQHVWSVESRAKSTPARGKTHSKSASSDSDSPTEESQRLQPSAIALQLIQADTSLLGGVIQALQERWLKSTWNLNRSWGFYSAALKAIDAAEHALATATTPHAQAEMDRSELAELRAWAQLGEGSFEFLLSLLPPTVIRIGGWMGFSGDRQKAVQLLTDSYTSSMCASAFSAFALINFVFTIITYMSESEAIYLPVVEAALQWMHAHAGESAFYLLMQSRLARHRRQLSDAIQLSSDAISRASAGGWPRLGLQMHPGWCAFFLQEWRDAVLYFDQLIFKPDTPAGGYNPTTDYVTDRTPWTPAQISQLTASQQTLVEPSRLNSQAFYALLIGLSHMHLHLESEEAQSEAKHAAAEPSPAIIVDSTSADPNLAPSPEPMPSPSPPPPDIGSRVESSSRSNSLTVSSPMPAQLSPSSLGEVASSSAGSRASRDHLNRAYFYIQTALSLLDPKRPKPMDVYSRRKCTELLARPVSHLPATIWVDTGDLYLKWNAAQQMPPTQIEHVVARLRAIARDPPSYLTLEQQACAHLYTANMLRGLGAAALPHARQSLDAFALFLPTLQRSSSRARTDGTLSFGHFESAMVYFGAGEYARAKQELKLAQSVGSHDQYHIMQVRSHALARMIKEATRKQAERRAAGVGAAAAT